MRDEFHVVLFFPDGSSHYAARWLDGRSAVLRAKYESEKPAASAGFVRRIIITDGGDDTCFEWKFGEGVTFPRRGADGKFV